MHGGRESLHVFTALDIRWRNLPYHQQVNPHVYQWVALYTADKGIHVPNGTFSFALCLHNKNLPIKGDCIHVSLRFITTQNTEVNIYVMEGSVMADMKKNLDNLNLVKERIFLRDRSERSLLTDNSSGRKRVIECEQWV